MVGEIHHKDKRQMLVELITKNAGQDQQNYGYYPAPSKVGQCIRALAYHAIGVEPDKMPDRAYLVFGDGNWHEELIKDHIRKTVFELTEWKGKSQKIDIAVINGRTMRGEIDGLLTDPQGTQWLLEIKSINHFGFERLDKEPQDDHRRQTNLYLHGLNEAGMNITKALILYKNKNTSAMKEFAIEYDKDQAIKDIEMFEQIAKWAKEKTVPPRPYDRDVDWQCGYCRFTSTCYKNYEKEFENLSENVELDEEIETKLKYYLEVSGYKKEYEAQADAIKAEIKKLLKDKGIQGGHAGPYIAKISLLTRKTIDSDKIPKDILPEIQKVTQYEKLTIRKADK